jgi:hypothetical protein
MIGQKYAQMNGNRVWRNVMFIMESPKNFEKAASTLQAMLQGASVKKGVKKRAKRPAVRGPAPTSVDACSCIGRHWPSAGIRVLLGTVWQHCPPVRHLN